VEIALSFGSALATVALSASVDRFPSATPRHPTTWRCFDAKLCVKIVIPASTRTVTRPNSDDDCDAKAATHNTFAPAPIIWLFWTLSTGANRPGTPGLRFSWDRRTPQTLHLPDIPSRDFRLWNSAKNTTAKMSLTNCRFYEEKYPEIDSFVMVNVKQVRWLLLRNCWLGCQHERRKASFLTSGGHS
jgi:hypothetical protein